MHGVRIHGTVRMIVGAALLVAVGWPDPASAQLREIAPEAREYLDDALELMEARSINRENVDWEEIRAGAYVRAAGASTSWDTYPAITEALVGPGTEHSFLRPPLEYLVEELGVPPEVASTIENPTPTVPEGQLIDGRIAHVRIPGFSGPEPDAFAIALLTLVEELDEAGVCGWVVDLRGNGGGNMWPMLQGITPVLGDETPGYFRYPTGRRDAWPLESPTDDRYRLGRPNPPVAVLHDSDTASSGEAIVVAFRGRSDTRSFGQETAGLSTSNEMIELSDGAVMVLTTAAFEDRDGVMYGGIIRPDVVLPPEDALESAVDWLGATAACSDPA